MKRGLRRGATFEGAKSTSSILLIDDDSRSRRAIELLLQGEGYTVRCAKNGREGLAAFQAERPDVVITDIIMPEKEGLETIMALRAAAPDSAIIAISGGGRFCGVDFLHIAERLGADHAIAKPFEPEQLLAAVRACCSRYSATPC